MRAGQGGALGGKVRLRNERPVLGPLWKFSPLRGGHPFGVPSLPRWALRRVPADRSNGLTL